MAILNLEKDKRYTMEKFDYGILIKLLNKAADAYYNSGTPIMSDAEYDIKMDELREFEEKTGIIFSNSPTQKVGASVLFSLKKVQITPKPMLSLGKCHSDVEVAEFANNQNMIAMVKLDGLSVRVKYNNGKLISANTRGNGVEGTDITEHIKQFQNIPLTIPNDKEYIIDGEAIIKIPDFETINKNGEFKNPRNAASGALNVLETGLVKDRKLSFIAWDVIYGYSSDFNYLSDKLEEAKAFGFEIVPYVFYPDCGKTINDVNKELMSLNNEYPCDGVVWKYNNFIYGQAQGSTNHHFKDAIAWKPEIETTESHLRNIIWQGGRGNKLTPVAEFDPIEIEGSIVERASLHNYSIMVQTLGEHPWEGESIDVYKANLIIPQILEGHGDETGHERIDIPSVCPYCGQPITKEEHNGVIDLCCNNPSCDSKLINRLIHFCGKTGLNIKGLSKATLQMLIDNCWVSNFENIFQLDGIRDWWINQPGWGEKSVDNILNAISSSERTELWRAISAAGIPLIGVSTAKQLANYFGTWDDFREAVGHFDFTQLPDIAEQTANKINNYDYAQMDVIMNKYITCAPIEVEEAQEQLLEGKTFCITGSLTTFKNRDELKEKIESLGGKVTGSVTSKTSYLINNDLESTSSKNERAKKLGIPIISEEKFLKIFNL